MQYGYNKLVHKESTYGRSVKAILDLRIQMLAVWDSAPQTLPSISSPIPSGDSPEIASSDCAGDMEVLAIKV